MNTYEFDSQALGRRIDRAQSVHELAPVTVTLLGLARFAAERIKFNDGDSCFCADYAGGGQANRVINGCIKTLYYSLILDCKKFPCCAKCFGRTLQRISSLHCVQQQYINDIIAACKSGELQPRHIDPVFSANVRRQIIAHLTDMRTLLVLSTPKMGLRVARTIAATALLLSFAGNLGCLYSPDSAHSYQLPEVKCRLHAVKKTLFDAIAIVGYKKRFSVGTSGEYAVTNSPVTFLDTLRYDVLYAGYVPRAVGNPLEYLVERHNVFSSVCLKQDHASSTL